MERTLDERILSRFNGPAQAAIMQAMTLIEQRSMLHVRKKPCLYNYVVPRVFSIATGTLDVDTNSDAFNTWKKVQANFAAVASLLYSINSTFKGDEYRPATWARPLRDELKIAAAFFDTVRYDGGEWRQQAPRQALDWS